MQVKQWSAFVLLGLIWGSSFLWIKLAVQDAGPFTVVALRLLFGVAGLLVVMLVTRQSWPRQRHILLAYLVMGVINTALPFSLITWGAVRIDSSLAAILNGTVPLFTIIIAHFSLPDDKITPARMAGLLVGFVGIVTLVSRDLGPGALSGSLLGQAAVIAASICYAAALSFSRRNLRNQPPVVQSFMVLLFADAIMWLTLPIVERPISWPGSALGWFAIAWLGVLGSCVAYLLFFYLVNSWGPTRTSVVTYVFPVIGLLLGIIFLREPVDLQLLLGSALIVGGIVVVNLKRRGRQPAPPPVAAQDQAVRR
jgi:drug/metabolite transporter (DMT)-like permease